MINLNIKNLLDLIQKESSALPGSYERRLPTESSMPIYLGVEVPSNLYKFSFVFDKNFDELLSVDGTDGFSISVIKDPKNSGVLRFSINLLHTKYAEIFLILCTDLLNVLAAKSSDERITLINLNKRLDYWRQFLKRSKVDKLTTEEEIGLIGELLILKNLLEIDSSFNFMDVWKGPLGATHDFINHGVSIEVKTSTIKRKRFVKISSEFQLDVDASEKLFLAHLEIIENVSSSNFFNLVTLEASIKEILPIDVHAIFDGFLACVGYKHIDAYYYEKNKYSLAEGACYRISENFPRLTNENLSPNISDVQYKLNLSGLDPYKVEMEDVLNIFLGN